MSRTGLWIWFAGSLAAILFGGAMLCWEVDFRLGAREVRGAIVLDPDGRKYLEVPDEGKVVRFPIISPEDQFDRGVGTLTVLYNAELHRATLRDSSDTELLCYGSFAAMGAFFLILAVVGLQRARCIPVVDPRRAWKPGVTSP